MLPPINAGPTGRVGPAHDHGVTAGWRPAPVFVERPPPTDEGLKVGLRIHRIAAIHHCVPSPRRGTRPIHRGARRERPERMQIGESTTPEWMSRLGPATRCDPFRRRSTGGSDCRTGRRLSGATVVGSCGHERLVTTVRWVTIEEPASIW